MRKTLMAATAALVGSFGVAAAADLGGYNSSLKDEPVGYAPITWSGFYIGLHAGAAWGDWENTDINGYNAAGGVFGDDTTAFIGGGQLGYNWQVGSIVLGVEGELGYLGLDSDAQFPGFIGDPTRVGDSIASFETDLYGTIAGRLGYAYGGWLLYAKGGAAFVNAEASYVDPNPSGVTLVSGTSASDTLTGWVVGGGVEYAMAGGWSLKVEYLHFDLDDITVSAVDSGGGTRRFEFDTDIDTVKVGVNYKFGARNDPLK
jgi:outer membrane immunogenic protein